MSCCTQIALFNITCLLCYCRVLKGSGFENIVHRLEHPHSHDSLRTQYFREHFGSSDFVFAGDSADLASDPEPLSLASLVFFL
jgi:hypothetical protein